ncbi:hypothetical protein D9M68_538730 [compost metagenome]
MVDDGGPVKGGGARDGQRQARIVHPRIEIQEAAKQPFLLEGRAVREHLGRRQLLVQDALAPAARHVVRPEQAFKGLGQALVEHAVLFQDRKEKRQPLHKMAGIAPQPLAFVQRMAHQAEISLLDIAQAAVHHLRGFGGRAGGEIVLLDDGGAIASQARVQGRVDAGDAAPDDDDVEIFGFQPVQLFLPIQAQWFGAGHFSPVLPGLSG